MIRTAIANQQSLLELDRRNIRRIVRTVLRGEGVPCASISLAFFDNHTMQTLNKQYLKHDGPTDVITFPLSAADESTLSGEIVVSTEVAQQVAQQRGHAPAAELALYVIHGLLHLCGYDDSQPKVRQAMRNKEAVYLAQLGVRLSGRVDG